MISILTLLFVFELYLFVYIDYCKYNTVYTPVFFLGSPFALVLLIAVLVGPFLGFLPVSETTIIIWCLGTLVFWLSGSLVTFSFIKSKLYFPFIDIFTCRLITSIIMVISWFFIIVLFVSFIKSFLFHGNISSEAFSADFASKGVAAHCLSLMKYNAAYLIAIENSRKIQRYIIFILTFVFLFLYNAKGGVILTALVSLFAKFIVSRSRLNFIKILFISSLGVSLFAFSYFIALGRINFNFLLFHFFAYVVAGIVGLSEHLRQSLPVDIDFFIIFQPIRNVFNVLTGGEIADRISELWVSTNILYAKKSNVKTFFGDIYIYSGAIKGILVSSFFGIVSYLFLIFVILKNNLVNLVLYLFVISSLMLGWFNFYFNDLFYYEVIVYVIFLIIISEIVKMVFPVIFINNSK